jgi:hypothetical protein
VAWKIENLKLKTEKARDKTFFGGRNGDMSQRTSLLEFAFLIGRKWENKRACCKRAVSFAFPDSQKSGRE